MLSSGNANEPSFFFFFLFILIIQTFVLYMENVLFFLTKELLILSIFSSSSSSHRCYRLYPYVCCDTRVSMSSVLFSLGVCADHFTHRQIRHMSIPSLLTRGKSLALNPYVLSIVLMRAHEQSSVTLYLLIQPY